MDGALDAPELLGRVGEGKQLLAKADGHDPIPGPVHHQRGRIDRADQQVVAERIAEQCANRDEPVCGRGDVGDRRIGRVEYERANLLARGERDRNPGSKRLP